jgi:DNA topoisomerase I
MTVMHKKLLIVESPTKARTISKYLGNDFEVVATIGHLRDLPMNKMGVDLKSFDVDYVVDSRKKKVVDEIKKKAKKIKDIYLASDPDREGEAIAWHVSNIIEECKLKDKKIQRVVFHEITKEAVLEAIKKPREIDLNLVDAQQGRRILDRVVGYSLSPILWRKVRRGLSAGRVQSVALRLIVEREKEIENFKKEKYFRILAQFKKGFGADLIKIDGKKITITEKLNLFDGDYKYSKTILDKKAADNFLKKLDSDFLISKVEGRESRRSPLPAFTTSKLQQAASRRFGWSGKQTMSVAQKLYERGLISYHRTDSVYLSDKAISQFRKFIEKEYGHNYLSDKVRVYKNNSKNAQEAHEAIRPTNAGVKTIEGDAREVKLYEMIWKRAVATQGALAKFQNTKVELSNQNSLFLAKGVKILFDGFLKISGDKYEDQILPNLTEGEKIKAKKVEKIESETMSPPRYSDASLVSSLEKQGIGRPSTYAPIISTIIMRQYVEKEEGRFKPTVLGKAVNEYLVTNFARVVSLPFTAEMEEDLDEIALGQVNWKKMMKDFYKIFSEELKKAGKDSERVKIETEKLGKKCPECGKGELVIRLGRFGKFISCSRFPECKYTERFSEEAGFDCPECGAPGVVRRTKTGRKFYGCSKYPKCKWAGWKKP